MARGQNKLTAKGVEKLAKGGRYGDGGGLYLDVKDADSGPVSKVWTFLYRSPVHRTAGTGKQAKLRVGKLRQMGFGPFGVGKDGSVTLAMARDKAAEARKLIVEGKDPIDDRRRAAEPVQVIPTFGELADQFITSMEGGWKNEKHVDQWRMTLTTYAATLRDKPVDQIGVADVLECLKPHWEQRPETAGRLRGRIERVLNAAKAQGFRSGENPAAWHGHLENLLPSRQKLTRGHHAALPYNDVPAFLAKLRERSGLAALCLEFTILTAVRSGESRGTRWSEIDLDAKVWNIPAERMKAGTAHRVPLTPRMLAILAIVKPLARVDGLVFPGTRSGAPLSDMSLSAVLRRMKVNDITVHGFRSSFRDWCGSATAYPRELAEEALAHVIGSKVERAYRRADALERRRELMATWEKFCAGSDVIDLASRRAAS
jgi:integrase